MRAKTIFTACVLLVPLAVAAIAVAGPSYDDFNTNPDPNNNEWMVYNRAVGGGAISQGWNGSDAWNLGAVAPSWEGLYRVASPGIPEPGKHRTASEPVTLLVKNASTTATDWSLVGLTISQEVAPAYNSLLPGYTLLIGSGTATWDIEVKGYNGVNINDTLYKVSTGVPITTPLTDYRLNIVRAGDEYRFQVNGATRYSDNAVARYGRAGADGLVNYAMQYGAGTGTMNAVVDNYGVYNVAQTYADAVVANNPVVYYRMQETAGTVAHDSGPGTPQNGTYTALNGIGPGPTLNQPGPTLSRMPGNLATSYNGSSVAPDYLHATALSGVLGEKFSVEFWFNTTRPESEQLITGYMYSRGSNNKDFNVGIDGSYDAEGLKPNNLFLVADNNVLASDFNPAENTWYHLVATYDRTDANNVRACLYVDGAKIIDGTVGTSQILADTSNIFGVREDGNWAFQGSLDEAAIYNTVLSQADVTAHYDAAQVYDVPEPSSLVLLGLGLLGLLAYAWRKQK
jgi:hypothetical protein